MQGPWDGGMSQGIDGYEHMVYTFAEQANTFCRSWGRRANLWFRAYRLRCRCNALISSGLGKPLEWESTLTSTVCFKATGRGQLVVV